MMPVKKMLVVVDYQNDFVDGSLGFPGAELLDAGITAKVQEYTRNGGVIVATRDSHLANYLETREGKALPVPHCLVGSKGWDLYGEAGRTICRLFTGSGNQSCVTLLNKETFGVSPENMLVLTRQYPKVDEIELVGLVTNMCVVSNVCCFQAAYPHAQITVDSSLVASFDKTLHEKTLDVLRGLQVQVI